MKRHSFAVSLALAALAILGLAGPAAAGDQKPFRGIYEGSFTQAPIPGTPTALVVAKGTGKATRLGHFSFDFPLAVNVALQTGSGTYKFTAANGDTVVAEVLAISSLLPNGLRRVQEIGTITGGTGRFAGATGSFIGERFLDRATGNVSGSFGGTIDLRDDDDDDDAKGNRTLIGDATMVDGNLIVTWARVRKKGEIKKVGVTIPVALFDDQPEEGGDGPAGAIASLVFPEIVQDTTYFNHFELHSNPHGHDTAFGSANPIRNSVPHFDFHFYAIDEADVLLIPATPPGPPFVLAALLPAGYRQPGPSILEMGRHSTAQSAFDDPGFLIADMIAGFLPNATQMHFIEPMISREFLLERNDFELSVPMPAKFGRSMLYPTKFEVEYDSDLDAYHFVFSDFAAVE